MAVPVAKTVGDRCC